MLLFWTNKRHKLNYISKNVTKDQSKEKKQIFKSVRTSGFKRQEIKAR